MNLDRAKQIVGAITDRSLFKMGFLEGRPVGSLEGVSLAEMLDATAAVEAENERAAEEARQSGGSYSIMSVPAERLIAAVYAVEHYTASSDAIVAMPHPKRPELALVLVAGTCRMPSGEETDGGDE